MNDPLDSEQRAESKLKRDKLYQECRTAGLKVKALRAELDAAEEEFLNLSKALRAAEEELIEVQVIPTNVSGKAKKVKKSPTELVSSLTAEEKLALAQMIKEAL